MRQPGHATDREFIKRLAQRTAATSSTSSRARCPGQSIAYFGPDIRIPDAAAGAQRQHGRAHQRRVAELLASTAWRRRCVIFTILDPITHKIPIPIPVPNINAFKPPLGAAADAAGQGRVRRRRGATDPTKRRAHPRLLHEQRRSHQRQRLAGRDALRAHAALAHAGRRARRGPGLRRPVLRRQRHPQHQARRIQAELQPVARRTDLNTPRVVA